MGTILSGTTVPDLLGKMEIPDIVQIEKETNQDKKGPLSWNDYLGDPSTRPCHEDKRKNQVTTTAEKKDDTDSTAAVTAAAFTSAHEPEWDDNITEGLCSRNNNIEQPDLRLWKKTISEACPQVENTCFPSLQGKRTT